MAQKPLGAQISHMLKDRGVDVIFGIPGVHNQEMYRGIEEAGITHVLARHEQGAGFMADGYARATGRPGVAYVISGPGLCNIMTPMGQAYSDSVPMLVISSVLDETEARRGQLHQMKDQEGAAAAVCDWSVTARTADAAYALIDRALVECQQKRKRPKHLAVPIRLLEGDAPSVDVKGPHAQAYQSEATSSDIDSLVAKLMVSQRPLFVIGGGCLSGDPAPLRSVLQKTGAASFTSNVGRGLVVDDPLHLGAFMARPSSADIFAQADLVVAAGTDLAEVDLWRDHTGQSCPTCYINIDAEVLAKARSDDQAILADASQVFAALDANLPDAPQTTDWSVDAFDKLRVKWRAQVNAERPGIVPVADALKAAMPSNTMIFSDMTQFAYAANEVYPMDRPGHWHHPSGFGTLGYALPAAIGGKVGVGDQPVVAILGDYGFQYTVQELAVAVELGLTLPIIIWDNGKLGEIEESMTRAQIAPNAVIQRNPDFLRLAAAYGAASAQVNTLSDLAPVLSAAFAADGPTVIRIPSDVALTSN
ncbi:MAG: thiamine pyrophosphate-binding protein [Pseudomonadota bacterium]